MIKILNFDAEILARFPQIKTIKKADTSFIIGENKEVIMFITLTASGIKKEGQPFLYYLENECLAVEHYMQHLFKFLNKKITTGTYELVWRMMPEIMDYKIGGSVNSGKIVPKLTASTKNCFNILSRLLIKPIAK